MPNWIEGTLKLRGKAENLRKFFVEGVTPAAEVTEYASGDKNFCFKEYTHITGTRRAFIMSSDIGLYRDYGTATVCLPFKQAWAIKPEVLAEISKRYGIDIRVYGFEMGLQFCQEIEVLNGQITINREIRYDDWDWECPMPLMGG